MITLEQTLETKSISAIAKFIKQDWKNVYFGAQPYLDAMLKIGNISDDYYLDSGESIVNYFLANASTYRGANAKQIKQHLKNLIKENRN